MFILCDVCFGLTGRQDSTIEIILEKKNEENEKKKKKLKDEESGCTMHTMMWQPGVRRMTGDERKTNSTLITDVVQIRDATDKVHFCVTDGWCVLFFSSQFLKRKNRDGEFSN